MSQYAARIRIGWIDQVFEGDDPCDIIRKVEEVQDFSCMLGMGRMEEDKKGQKELDKLEAFLNKYYDEKLTMKDIQKLNVHLSVGDIVCHGIAESEEEVEALKAKMPL